MTTSFGSIKVSHSFWLDKPNWLVKMGLYETHYIIYPDDASEPENMDGRFYSSFHPWIRYRK